MCVSSSELNKETKTCVWFQCEGEGSRIIPSRARHTVVHGRVLQTCTLRQALPEGDQGRASPLPGPATPKPLLGAMEVEL